MSNPQNTLTKSENGRVDIHHHILPEEYVAKLKGIGITTAIGRKFPDWSPKKSLGFMKKNGINKRAIIDMINQNTPGKSIDIGSIEVLKGFSFFEIDSNYEKELSKAFKNARFKGQRVNIEIANKKK